VVTVSSRKGDLLAAPMTCPHSINVNMLACPQNKTRRAVKRGRRRGGGRPTWQLLCTKVLPARARGASWSAMSAVDPGAVPMRSNPMHEVRVLQLSASARGGGCSRCTYTGRLATQSAHLTKATQLSRSREHADIAHALTFMIRDPRDDTHAVTIVARWVSVVDRWAGSACDLTRSAHGCRWPG
jgi:hypothetical protein